jgi:hypothetical protein
MFKHDYTWRERRGSASLRDAVGGGGGGGGLLGHLGGGRGRRGAAPASGDSGKGEVWKCGVEGSGGAAAMGVMEVRRRRRGWACSGGGGSGCVWVWRWRWALGRWRRRFFCAVIFFSQPTFRLNNGPFGPFILVAILGVV